jgi:hypothetical protein
VDLSRRPGSLYWYAEATGWWTISSPGSGLTPVSLGGVELNTGGIRAWFEDVNFDGVALTGSSQQAVPSAARCPEERCRCVSFVLPPG